MTYTWLLLNQDTADATKREAIGELVRWMLIEGQDHAQSLRYVPLPSNVVQAALAQLDASAH